MQARIYRRSTSVGSLGRSIKCTWTRQWTTSRSSPSHAGEQRRSEFPHMSPAVGRHLSCGTRRGWLKSIAHVCDRTRGCCFTTTATECRGRQPTGRSGCSTKATHSTYPCPYSTCRRGLGRPASAYSTARRLDSSSILFALSLSKDSRWVLHVLGVHACPTQRTLSFCVWRVTYAEVCRTWRASQSLEAANFCPCLGVGATPCESASFWQLAPPTSFCLRAQTCRQTFSHRA